MICIRPKCFFWSLASKNDDFRTAICQNQNLNLIKFGYSGIKIIILGFSYFIKHKHIEFHADLLEFFFLIYDLK